MSELAKSFLELPGVSIDDAHVAVLPVPFEGTVCYGKGTGQGPAAILDASHHLETFDEELGWDVGEHLRFATLPEVGCDPAERPEAYLTRLKQVCAGHGLAPPFALCLGGEHSVTPALLAGLRKDLDQITVVQIDAHADLRSEYQGSIHSHACAMRRVLELGAKRLVAIGIRSASPEEHELAQSDPRIQTWWAHDLQDASPWEKLRDELVSIEGPCYLTVDIDGLDVSMCPGTGTPMPGGLSWQDAMRVLRWLIKDGKADVFAADITEVAPQKGTQVNEQVAAKLAFKMVSYRFFDAIMAKKNGG